MKSILVIGMGRFGRFLSLKFSELGNDVMIVDKNEDIITELAPHVSSAQIGDCAKEGVLESLGVRNFDIVFVCVGTDFLANLVITSLAKELGAKYVVSKANQTINAKFLLRNGADDVVYPEKAYAEKIAVKYSAEHVFDLLQLDDDFFICEIPVTPVWVGETPASLDFRTKYKVNILATKNEGEKMRPVPSADHVFYENEHLMVLGAKKDIDKLLKQL